MLKLFSLLASCLSLAGVLTAADLSGIWVGQIPNRNGDMTDIAFKFTQSGSHVGGKLYGDYGSSPIVEGKLAGEAVMFVVISREQAGNQINTTRLRFTGTIQDDGMELVRERESSVNAGNGGKAETRNATKQIFYLKRLLRPPA